MALVTTGPYYDNPPPFCINPFPIPPPFTFTYLLNQLLNFNIVLDLDCNIYYCFEPMPTTKRAATSLPCIVV